jgi:hypothetical protein
VSAVFVGWEEFPQPVFGQHGDNLVGSRVMKSVCGREFK